MDSQGDNADRDLQGKLGGAFAQNKHFQGGGRGWVAEVAYSVPNFKKKTISNGNGLDMDEYSCNEG